MQSSNVVTDPLEVFTIESAYVYRRGNVVTFSVKATVKPGKEAVSWHGSIQLPSFAAPGYFAPCCGNYYGPGSGLKPLAAATVMSWGVLQTDMPLKEGWTVDFYGTYIIK